MELEGILDDCYEHSCFSSVLESEFLKLIMKVSKMFVSGQGGTCLHEAFWYLASCQFIMNYGSPMSTLYLKNFSVVGTPKKKNILVYIVYIVTCKYCHCFTNCLDLHTSNISVYG